MYQNNYKMYKSHESYKKSCKRMLLKNAVKLCFASLSFNVINFFAVLFFAKAKRRTRLLVFTDRVLGKKICRCQKLYSECEDFRYKVENIDKVPIS